MVVTRESLARKIAERQHLDSVVDSTRSMVLDVISSEKRRRELRAYTSQVLPFGVRVMYKYTAVPTGNLDQRLGHGIWVGKAPMTDEHTILTEWGPESEIVAARAT